MTPLRMLPTMSRKNRSELVALTMMGSGGRVDGRSAADVRRIDPFDWRRAGGRSPRSASRTLAYRLLVGSACVPSTRPHTSWQGPCPALPISISAEMTTVQPLASRRAARRDFRNSVSESQNCNTSLQEPDTSRAWPGGAGRARVSESRAEAGRGRAEVAEAGVARGAVRTEAGPSPAAARSAAGGFELLLQLFPAVHQVAELPHQRLVLIDASASRCRGSRRSPGALIVASSVFIVASRSAMVASSVGDPAFDGLARALAPPLLGFLPLAVLASVARLRRRRTGAAGAAARRWLACGGRRPSRRRAPA